MNGRPWTKGEEEYLINYFNSPQNKNYSETIEFLTGYLDRSKKAIEGRVRDLRKSGHITTYFHSHFSRKVWTEDEDDYLESYCNDPSNRDVKVAAEFLGRTETSVKSRLAYLRKNNNYSVDYFQKRVWTEEEKEYFIKYYPVYPAKVIARHLGIPISAVYHYQRKLGLPRKIKPSLARFDTEIRQLADQGYFIKEIAEKLGTSYKQLFYYMQRKGIEYQKVDRKTINYKNHWWAKETELAMQIGRVNKARQEKVK